MIPQNKLAVYVIIFLMNSKNVENRPVFCDSDKIEKLRKKKVKEVDAFSFQLKELFFIENPKFVGQEKEEVYKTKDFKKFSEKKENDFQYIFFPWNNSLVKCVNHEDYFKIKTNRNQDLITLEEQKKLYDYRVAVLGMSVGSNIAFVLTQAGISREITIADFDELDTSNLNRILAGVHQVGVKKTLIASQKIYEDNPYAGVNALPEGINKENLEKLLKEKKIDCIVEEVDNLGVKIDVRFLAMKYKVPVLMATDNGDGVVLHVERYDLGYNKIFHQEVGFWQEKMTSLSGGASKEVFGEIITNMIMGGIENVDPKVMMSVKRILNKELVSWAQLGSAAILAGVVTTFAVKKIALGEDKRLEVRSFINPTY